MGSTSKRATSAGREAGPTAPPDDDDPAASLRSAHAVRERCARVMEAALAEETRHFRFDAARLGPCADFVVETLRARYPDLDVPLHSRWRHFDIGGVDRFATLADRERLHGAERARVMIDLVVPSVLLDAGAGAAWRYPDAQSGALLDRSEGLAIASLALFASGALSSSPQQPLRADAEALAALEPAVVERAFAVSAGNPLVGVAGRVALLQQLGEAAQRASSIFGSPARIGNLYDHFSLHARDGRIDAAQVLATLLRALATVWPGRIALAGVPLGDCWRHPAACRDDRDPGDGLVPLHKLTQWLAYSLVEPLAAGGIEVTNLDALTGLAEYRNGGLMIDTGVLALRDGPATCASPLAVDSEPVVEWRALTVIALDRVAALVRERLGVDAAAFPLAKVLEGGTWAAGRRIAGLRRAGGTPPLVVASDGTVF